MSVHISGSGVEYVGIINGVTYRIDPSANALSQGIFGQMPFGMQPFSSTKWLTPIEPSQTATTELHETPPATAAPTDATPALDLLVEQARAEREARAVRLFKRESGEPLRAGHPDLWALLVAGTCLEGSVFQSA